MPGRVAIGILRYLSPISDGFNVASTSRNDHVAAEVTRLKLLSVFALSTFLFLLSHAPDLQAATLLYSTFLGGAENDSAYALTIDGQGNTYVAGDTTNRFSFPTLNALQPQSAGAIDLFIAKFNPAGELLFSTYLGGRGSEYANAIALDAIGNIYVVGQTRSTDFPVTDDAFQPDYAGGSAFGEGDGFLVKLSNDGGRLLYASYLGGSGDDVCGGMAIGADGKVSIAGGTDSRNFPIKNALQPKFGGGLFDSFVAQFDASLTNLVFSTYFGGEDQEVGETGLALDPAGHVYLCGRTRSTNFPITPNAMQTNHVVLPELGGNWDAFIAKFLPDGSGLVYSTYLGHATDDSAIAIAADAEGYAYVTGTITTGWTEEDEIPRGFQPQPGYGRYDAYVAKIKPNGSGMEWFSYLGGSGEEEGFGIALDRDRNVYVTGIVNSRDFPVVDAVQSKYGGGPWDAFVAKVSADGKTLLYSTYLGGRSEEWGYGLAVDTQGNAVVAGQTMSPDFATLNAYQPSYATNSSSGRIFDAFITKISPAVQPPPLRIARSANNLFLTWSTNFVGYTLESAADIGMPAIWKKTAASPLVIGGQHTVIERAAGQMGIYRLRRP